MDAPISRGGLHNARSANFASGDVTVIVARWIVHESRLAQSDDSSEAFLVIQYANAGKNCFTCLKTGSISRNCWCNKKSGNNNKDTSACLMCGKVGHLAINCKSTGSDENGNGGIESVMISVTYEAFVSKNFKRQKTESAKWILESGCTSHMANCRDYFRNFISSNGVVKVGDSEKIGSEGLGRVKL